MKRKKIDNSSQDNLNENNLTIFKFTAKAFSLLLFSSVLFAENITIPQQQLVNSNLSRASDVSLLPELSLMDAPGFESATRSAQFLSSEQDIQQLLGGGDSEKRLPLISDQYKEIDLGQLEGESIDTLTGHPVNEIADLQWPGDGGLGIQLSRRWDLPFMVTADPDPNNNTDVRNPRLPASRWYQDNNHVGGVMGDWQLNIPYISIGIGHTIGDYDDNLYLRDSPGMAGSTYVGVCNQPAPTGNVCMFNDAAQCAQVNPISPRPWKDKNEMWQGVRIKDLAQEGSKELLRSVGLLPGNDPYVTTDNWTADCIKSSIDDPNDPVMNGFRVKTDGGLIYHFTEVRQINFPDEFTGPWPIWDQHETAPEARIYLSKIEDENNNSLTYTYLPASGDDTFFGYLSEINASDGRRVVLDYENSTIPVSNYYQVQVKKRVSEIRAIAANEDGSDRVISYDYNGPTGRLTQVNLPNGQNWQYQRNIVETGQILGGNVVIEDTAEFIYPEGGKLIYRLGNYALISSYDGQDPLTPVIEHVFNDITPILAVGQRQVYVNPTSANFDAWNYYYNRTTRDIAGQAEPYDPRRKAYNYHSFVVGSEDVTYVNTVGDLLSPFDKTMVTSAVLDRPNGSIPDPITTSNATIGAFVADLQAKINSSEIRRFTFIRRSGAPHLINPFPTLVGTNCLSGSGFSVGFRNGVHIDCPFSSPRSSRFRLTTDSEFLITKENATSAEIDIFGRVYIPEYSDTILADDWFFFRPKLIVELEQSERSQWEDNSSLVYGRCQEVEYQDLTSPRVLGLEKNIESSIGELDLSVFLRFINVDGAAPIQVFRGQSCLSNERVIKPGTQEYQASTLNRTYTPLGQLQSESDNGRTARTYTYHTNGNLHTATDELGSQTIFTDYFRGQARQVKQTGDAGAADDLTIIRNISSVGLVSSETNPRGFTTSFQYDRENQLTQVDFPIQADIEIDWDYSGYPVTKTIERKDLSQTYFKRIESYDGFGRLITTEEQDPVLNQSIFIRRDYDTKGRMIFKSYPYASSNTPHGVRNEFDLFSRPVKTYRTVDASAAVNTAYLTNDIIRQTNERGYVTNSYYRVFGTDPNQRELVRVETQVDLDEAGCAASATLVTAFERDVLGAIREVSRGCKGSDGSFISQQYDFNNKLLPSSALIPEKVNRQVLTFNDLGLIEGEFYQGVSGSSINYSYDQFNRLERVDFSDQSTPDAVYSYDKNNNISTKVNGANLTYGYNEIDQLSSQLLNIDGITMKLENDYTEYGAVSSITYPTGYVYQLQPDGYGRPRQAGEFVTSIEYYPNGEMNEMRFANGQVANYSLNNRNLIQDIFVADSNNNQTALDQVYTYDNGLNIKTLSDSLNPENNRVMAYDAMDRLVGVNYSGLGINASLKYDSKGNLTEKTDLHGTIAYHYPLLTQNNRLGSVSGARNASYTYDSYGAIASDGTNAYVYNRAEDLVAMTAAGNQADFVYDADRKRVKSTINGEVTYKMYSGNQLMFEFNQTQNWIKEYYYIGDQLVSSRKYSDPANSDIDQDGINDLQEIFQ